MTQHRYPGHESVPLVESELGTIPEGWKVSPLGNLITLQRGFDLPKPARSEGEIPVVASTGVAGTHGDAKVRGPGVTTGRSGSLGSVLFLGGDFWPLNTTLWVREYGESNPAHTFYLLQQIDLVSLNSGAAVPTLDRKNVHRALINRPPKVLMDLFEATMTSNLALRTKLTQLNEMLRKCRGMATSSCFQHS